MSASQKPTATRVASIHTWNKLGRIVNEGEKGILILAPVFKEEREETRTPAIPGNSATSKDESRRLVGFRTAFVYDLGQTHGKPLPEFAKTTGDPKQFADKLRALVAKVHLARIRQVHRASSRGFFRRQDSSAARHATRRRVLGAGA